MGLGLPELLQDGDAPGFLLPQHPPGVVRHTGGDGVHLLGLKEQQVLSRLLLVKGVVHLPLPGHLVKEGRGLHRDAAGGLPVSHELPYGLSAVGRPVVPVHGTDLPAGRPEDMGQPPRRQLARLGVHRDGAPGNIFLYQSITSSQIAKALWDKVSHRAYRSSRPGSGAGFPCWPSAFLLTSV